MAAAKPTKERFLEKIDISSGDCWEWTAYRHHQGYGEMFVDGRKEKAHRGGNWG